MHVGLLDCWTLCFENYLFKIALSLFGLSLIIGGSGDWLRLPGKIEPTTYRKCPIYYKENTPLPTGLAEEYKLNSAAN